MSPMQKAYNYLQDNPNDPIYFTMSPIPNYLSDNELLDAGEALTYSTMMMPQSLPDNAGLGFLNKTTKIAFGNPQYSRSFFRKKLDLKSISSPFGLEDWNIYQANLK